MSNNTIINGVPGVGYIGVSGKEGASGRNTIVSPLYHSIDETDSSVQFIQFADLSDNYIKVDNYISPKDGDMVIITGENGIRKHKIFEDFIVVDPSEPEVKDGVLFVTGTPISSFRVDEFPSLSFLCSLYIGSGAENTVLKYTLESEQREIFDYIFLTWYENGEKHTFICDISKNELSSSCVICNGKNILQNVKKIYVYICYKMSPYSHKKILITTIDINE